MNDLFRNDTETNSDFREGMTQRKLKASYIFIKCGATVSKVAQNKNHAQENGQQ